MKWYWWVVIGILGINALVIVVVGVFLLLDRLLSGRGVPGSTEGQSPKETARSGR